jgi:lysophospholipase L1-like esterase
LRKILFAVLLLCLTAAAHAQTAFALKNGDTVVFYGDSITDQRLYTIYTEVYVVTRFPHMRVHFVHSGWGGDTVYGGGGGPIDLRLDRDVIPYKPDVMTIMLGMNDAGYRPFDQNLYDRYVTGYRHIIDKVKAALPNIRITVIGPSPFDDVTRKPNFEGGYNAVLLRYDAFVKSLAAQDNLTYVDFNAPMTAMLEEANGKDPALAQKLIPDRVHPGVGGHLVMAEQLLKAWGAPDIVSAVDINAKNSSVTSAKDATISGLKADGNNLKWTQLDASLPMPYDMKNPEVALTVQSSDVQEALNQENLKVSDLSEPKYLLKIDGDNVGTFTKEDLEQGINLSQMDTPMSRQAMAVLALTFKHNDIHFLRWRNVQVPLQGMESGNIRKTLADLDALEGEIVAKEEAMAQPKSHHFELVAQP